MQKRSYSYSLIPGLEGDILYVTFEKNRGDIKKFSIQYVALIDGTSHEIMRFDTFHGYAHKHTFHRASAEVIIDLTKLGDRINDVFTESLEYIKRDFEKIKANYLST